MLGPLHQNEHFLDGTHPTSLKYKISTLSTKSQTFYTINIFYLRAPRDLHLYFGLWRAFLADLTTRNTSFSHCVCPRMRFFPLRSHVSRILCSFQQKEFFSDGPKGFDCIFDFGACS